MKKRLFLFVAIVAVIACLFAISVSADSINPSTSNEFGTLTTFDDPIGNTNIRNVKDDGTIARAVITDGKGNYYTIPSVYLLTEYTKPKGEFFLLNFSEISEKLNLGLSSTTSQAKACIIRFEFPADIYYVAAADAECIRGCANMVEVKFNNNLHFWDNNTPKMLSGCKSLTVVDVSMVNFDQTNSLYSIFESCTSLKKVILPEEPFKNGNVPLNYATNYMFNGCSALEEVVNLDSFFSGTTTVGYSMFQKCTAFTDVHVWEGVTSIGTYAFKAIPFTSFVVPDSVTSIGDFAFQDCKSLKTIALSKNITSIGKYAFEYCTALEKVFMPAPWLTISTNKVTFGQGVFKNTKSSGVTFYLMCTETQVATCFDQSAYTENVKDCWRGGTFVYNATLSDKCTNFLGGHEKPASVNSCTSGGNCVVCTTALAGIATSHNLVTTLTYPNGFAKAGVKATACQNWERCTAANESDAVDAIFTSVGYSYREDANRSGLTSGFSLDREALEEFIAFNPDADLVVSLFIVSPTKLTGENFFVNGALAAEKGIQVDISALEYDNYNYFVSGFTVAQMQNAELVFGMLVCNGEYEEVIQKQYAQGEESTTKAVYTDAKGFALNSVTVQSVDPEMVEALLPKNDQE